MLKPSDEERMFDLPVSPGGPRWSHRTGADGAAHTPEAPMEANTPTATIELSLPVDLALARELVSVAKGRVSPSLASLHAQIAAAIIAEHDSRTAHAPRSPSAASS
jgi:hypothetical protein